MLVYPDRPKVVVRPDPGIESVATVPGPLRFAGAVAISYAWAGAPKPTVPNESPHRTTINAANNAVIFTTGYFKGFLPKNK